MLKLIKFRDSWLNPEKIVCMRVVVTELAEAEQLGVFDPYVFLVSFGLDGYLSWKFDKRSSAEEAFAEFEKIIAQ